MKATRFEDLMCWQKARALIPAVDAASLGLARFRDMAMGMAVEVRSELGVALDWPNVFFNSEPSPKGT